MFECLTTATRALFLALPNEMVWGRQVGQVPLRWVLQFPSKQRPDKFLHLGQQERSVFITCIAIIVKLVSINITFSTAATMNLPLTQSCEVL